MLLLLASLSACATATTTAPSDPEPLPPAPAASEAFEARHAAFLQERGPAGRELAAKLDPADRVLASCIGSFSAPAASDLIYAIGRPGSTRVEIRDAGRLAVASIALPAEGVSGVELQCVSPEDVARRNAFFAEPGSIVQGNISSGGRWALCTYDEERPTFSCFALDPAAKLWSRAGGWIT